MQINQILLNMYGFVCLILAWKRYSWY